MVTLARAAHGRDSLRRAALTLVDIAWWLLFLLLLLAMLLPSLSRARELAKRQVCMSNLRGVLQGAHIYANDNVEWFPVHYSGAEPGSDGAAPAETNHRYIGTMGSHEFLKISQPTSPTISPTRSHPSRSLFLSVTQGYSTPGHFICPTSPDQEDELRNYGGDSTRGEDSAAQPGVTRFDFRGYDALSFGYQMPFGRRGKPRVAMDVRVVVVADKGPYFRAGSGGLFRTTDDAAVAGDGAPRGIGRTFEEIARAPEAAWRPYNSRNHGGEGQTAGFVDGHADFVKRPTVGLKNDNIYTLADDFASPLAAVIGRDPGEDDGRYGPLTNTDSLIVP
ncbi:MAG: hypothetical protein LC135_06795 [Phycisphaerae bacterium]|nr:hypothetical protein [Phycisphaerae bacterium]MCZ2399563.1 hypothetical protein [Phycisphaerae bacterium]NUQ49438.1 hypothetical protein [Phycisphaerae bacterium]